MYNPYRSTNRQVRTAETFMRRSAILKRFSAQYGIQVEKTHERATVVRHPRVLETAVVRLNANLRADEGINADFRKLVLGWLTSGPSLQKMDSRLKREVEDSIKVSMVWPNGPRAYWMPYPSHFQPVGRLLEAHMARIRGRDGPSLPSPEAERRNTVLFWFAELISYERCDLLGGPCGRCGKFYVKNTVRQKVYCSRKCGHDATSATVKDENHKAKLDRAQKAIDRLPKSARQNWKKQIENQEADITSSWLTRYIKEGELTPPRWQAN